MDKQIEIQVNKIILHKKIHDYLSKLKITQAQTQSN